MKFMLQIICHYTFFSNEVHPVASFLMLLFMGIIGLVAIRIWIGNKIDDRKLTVKLAERDLALMEEAKEILNCEGKNNEKLRDIQFSMNHKDWFFKGYISGATHGNLYFGTFIKKNISEKFLQGRRDRYLGSLFRVDELK